MKGTMMALKFSKQEPPKSGGEMSLKEKVFAGRSKAVNPLIQWSSYLQNASEHKWKKADGSVTDRKATKPFAFSGSKTVIFVPYGSERVDLTGKGEKTVILNSQDGAEIADTLDELVEYVSSGKADDGLAKAITKVGENISAGKR